MTKANFLALCEILRPRLEKQDTNFKKACTVEQTVGVALYRLAHPHYRYACLASRFGVGAATACQMVKRFIKAVRGEMGHLVRLPNTAAEKQRVVQGFARLGFPGARACLDVVQVRGLCRG